MKKLKPGDIILSTTDGFVSRVVRFMLRRKDDKAPYSHVAGYVGDNMIVEARYKVRLIPLRKFVKENTRFAVYRRRDLTNVERIRIALLAKGFIGRRYGYAKVLLLQPLDQLFGTNWFTHTLSFSKRIYCSQLYAKIYYAVKDIKINGVEPESCEPDDWHDEVTNNGGYWEEIFIT